METSSIILRLKQAVMAVVVLGVLAAFILPPLLATDYSVQQGTFGARILSSAAGAGIAARPIVRARVEDTTGRVFWIQMPPARSTAPDTKLVIDVWCETDSFDSCTARYWGVVPKT